MSAVHEANGCTGSTEDFGPTDAIALYFKTAILNWWVRTRVDGTTIVFRSQLYQRAARGQESNLIFP